MMVVELRRSFGYKATVRQRCRFYFSNRPLSCAAWKKNRQLEQLYYQAGLIHLPKGTALSPPSSQDISELKA